MYHGYVIVRRGDIWAGQIPSLKETFSARSLRSCIAYAESIRRGVCSVWIEGKVIQIDLSEVGHAWRNATEDDCPAHIQQEIAAKMVEEPQPRSKGVYRVHVASNGLHYRW